MTLWEEYTQKECVFYPATKETWEAYEKKRVTDEYYESLMRIGDVCLVKDAENTEWKVGYIRRKI